MARKTISQRIALAGGDQIREQLRKLGAEGEEAFNDIQAAAEKLKGPGADFARSMDQMKEKIRSVGEEMKRVGESMRSWGIGLSAAVTAPVGLMGRSFIQAASDAQEAASAFDFMFKESAGATREWAATVAKEMNRGKNAIEDQALAFQQLFAQVAPTKEAAIDLSKDFTVLAQDLSSFFNVAEGDALLKLQSGLAGSSEPLRAFGVFINENAVAAKGLEMGLGGVTGQLTDQEKVLARAALIMEQTSAAQGDAARTSGSYANQLKGLSGAWQDLSIALGTLIIPTALKVVEVFKSIVETILALPQSVQTAILIFAGLAAALGPILLIAGQMVLGFGALATGFSAALPAIVALGGGFTGLAAAMRTVMMLVAPMVAWPVVLAAAVGAMAVLLYNHWDSIVSYIAGAFESISEKTDAFTTSLGAKWNNLWAHVTEPLVRFKDTFFMVWDQIADHIETKLGWIREKIGSMIDWAAAKLSALQSAISSLTGGGSDSGQVVGPSTLRGYAGGGQIKGPGTSTSDSILARLSDGEFVVRARAVKHYGPQLFDMLNRLKVSRGSFPGFAQGGLITSGVVPPSPRLAPATGGGGPHSVVNLTIGGEKFNGLTAPRETADRLMRYAMNEEAKSAGRRPAWYRNG